MHLRANARQRLRDIARRAMVERGLEPDFSPAAHAEAESLRGQADAGAAVTKGSALDSHARVNTTSVYTAAQVFPMLPERLSTDLTSLNPDAERLAIVVDMRVGGDGVVAGGEVYRARVRNRAKLAYNAVAAWPDGRGPLPPAGAAAKGLDANLQRQDAVAQAMKTERHRR